MRRHPISLATCVLAMLPAAAQAQRPIETYRSVGDVRQRPSDEHDRPYFRETQSHRGWEIREPQFTIFADTSQQDAREAAGHVQQAWQAASRLASHWTRVNEQPDFALNALQVVITGERLRDVDAPPTSLNVVGIQTQVEIAIGNGQPKLAEQLVRMREGAAFGMLHAAGLDSLAPPWLMSGLASFAGQSGLTEEQLQSAAPAADLPRNGGQQWRFARSSPDVLAYPAENLDEAASRAAFLLTANDAKHAPALFAMLQQAQLAAQERAADQGGFSPEQGQPSPLFDQYFAEHRVEYEAWQANPKQGQPIFEASKELAPVVLSAEREMLVVLKLYHRLAERTPARRPQGGKIIELDKEGRAVARSTTTPALPTTFAAFAERLLDPAKEPWATLDATNNILLSSDRQRVQALLAPGRAAYALDLTTAGKTVLVRTAEDGTKIRGWLEPNSQDKTRPLARFELPTTKGSVRIRQFKPAPAVQARGDEPRLLQR